MLVDLVYPTKITWRVSFDEISDPIMVFGKLIRKKIKSDLRKLAQSEYFFKVEDVDVAYIERFVPLYKRNLETKHNILISDIRGKVIDNPRHNFKFQALSLYKNDLYLGGLIFSIRDDHFVGAYRAFPRTLEDLHLKEGVGILCDYFLYEYALKLKKRFVRRGKDRNCYGQNADIGLAMYKLKAGNTAYMLEQSIYEGESTCFVWDEKKTILIFGMGDFNSPIGSVCLLVPKETDLEEFKQKYQGLFKTFDLNISIIRS
jgi:hypothetical protein